MSTPLITPTEALLEVAKQHPSLIAVRSGKDQWSYAALWARVRQIADKIHDLDGTGNPVGLYMDLEIDYVAAAHAIWLSGRTVVFLSSRWAPEVLRAILERSNAHLVLFGSVKLPAMTGIRAVSTYSLVDSAKPPCRMLSSPLEEVVELVPRVCSIIPTSGSTGVPKSIVYPMRRSLGVLSEESSVHFQPKDGQWLRGGPTSLRPLFEIRRFMFNRTTLYLDPSSSVVDQCSALYEELESSRGSQMLRVHFTPSVFRAFADYSLMRADGSRLPCGFNRVYWLVLEGEQLGVRDLELAAVIFPSSTIACSYACPEVCFTGGSQKLIRPTDPIPPTISFGPAHGCTDLVLLDRSLSIIPRSEDGATGIVGLITNQSATHYLGNEIASQHMFRPWAGDYVLIYTDDIGCMQADGSVAIRGRIAESQKMDHLFDEEVIARMVASEIPDSEEDVMEDGTMSPASQATVVDDGDLDVITLEKDPVEKGDTFYPGHYSNRHSESTLIAVQPPVESTLTETINATAASRALNITPYGFLFVSWMSPLLRLGSKRPLSESDLLPLRRNDEALVLDRWMEPFWTQLRACFFDSQCGEPGLFKAIFAGARNLWMVSGALWFLSVCSSILCPLILQQIIVAASAPPPPTGNATALAEWTSVVETDTGGFPLIIYNTYALGGILLALKLVFTFCGRSSDQLVKRMAMDVKTALVSAVYKKSLRLSAENNRKYNKGYIMNLVNVDCESVSKAWEVIHQAWSIPLQMITVTLFLSRLLNVAAWASIGILLYSLFVLIMVVPVFMRRAAPKFMRLGDHRVKTIREVLDGIRAVKINGREKHFLEKLERIRTVQVGWLRKFNTGVATFVIVGQVTNTIMPLAAFSLFGRQYMGEIPATRVFPAISLFGMLVDPLISLPQLLSAIIIATTSWDRIYSFLLADEKPSTIEVLPPCINTDYAITITNGAFSWTALDSNDATSTQTTNNKVEDPDTDSANEDKEDDSGPGPLLRNVNISIRTGSLTAIVGNVGAGKSSLLSAIIGEMVQASGEVHRNGSIAYCAQQPWVQTSTIQDNILFGRPLDMHLLHRATQVTCFDSDLETFPYGMATQMSEKGNNLSGGQKARLALSRAVYSEADIYLFDDVLSALDPRVGRTVFTNCIKHALQGKTRVLVTHQLQYLNQVDHIIVVSDGRIVEQGSFYDLVVKDGELARLLSEVETKSSDSEDVKDDNKCKGSSGTLKPIVKEQGPASQVVAHEERNTGAISAETWWAYLRATGGIGMAIMLLVEIILLQSSVIILNQWLTWWTENTWHEKAKTWIGVYDGLGFASALAIVLLNTTILLSSTRASRTFHSKALQGVIYAPMWWFESQPIGRIMNRFSKDIEAIDQRLMPQLFQLVAGIGNLISTIVILGYSTPIMLALVIPMMIVYWFVLSFYRKSLRELKRLESTGRGPLQSRINETLDGIPTIMAYGRGADFENAVESLLDASNKPTFLRMHAEIWVALRMELMSSLIVVTLSMLAHTRIVGNSTQFVLALTYSSTLTYIMNLLLKSAANVEAEMNSVERLMNYSTSLPAEDAAYIDSDPAEGVWPSRGEIVLREVDAAYHSRPEKLVLRNVSLTFNAGETVFIVGRTGSGKSTLLSLLLRLIESSNGTVEIDGRNIKNLGVSTLRRGMQVIPQDPFLFSGTIRSCLDFDGKHKDDELWHALDLVGLKNFVSSQESKLDTPVEDNGGNYSVGQRQLLCLAAAILWNPRILLLDEATASIDAGADVFIQQAMRRSCPHATILSVMHRLSDKILEECDKVLVMEQGVPIEYASPKVLLARPDSMFAKLMAAARNGD